MKSGRKPILISDATLIDGVADKPVQSRSILVEAGRIRAIGSRADFGASPEFETIDARGKYVIPGLMNANVHLLGDISLENLVRYDGRYDELIAEAAQVALKAGLTTVFDTWGPRAILMDVRDKIAAGATSGSRIFCAGNIVGFDGPFSHDFLPKAAEALSPAFVERINATWVENVGRHLMWLTPDEVAREIRKYIAKGIDFVKYASNEHFGTSAGAFLAFSPEVQRAIVEVGRGEGLTVQAHTMSVEGLRIAVEVGNDLIQHANHTGAALIPESTLELMARAKIGAVVFPMTQARLDWLMANESYRAPKMWQRADTNARNLIRVGAVLLMANDGVVAAPQSLADPKFEKNWGGPWQESLFSLAEGHFSWLKAMEEKGCPAMTLLRAATRNIAEAYGKGKELGTLEVGKTADLLILDKNPLDTAENYRSIHRILKDGLVVDRDALPLAPLLTKPLEAFDASEYMPFLGGGKFPLCPLCVPH